LTRLFVFVNKDIGMRLLKEWTHVAWSTKEADDPDSGSYFDTVYDETKMVDRAHRVSYATSLCGNWQDTGTHTNVQFPFFLDVLRKRVDTSYVLPAGVDEAEQADLLRKTYTHDMVPLCRYLSYDLQNPFRGVQEWQVDQEDDIKPFKRLARYGVNHYAHLCIKFSTMFGSFVMMVSEQDPAALNSTRYEEKPSSLCTLPYTPLLMPSTDPNVYLPYVEGELRQMLERVMIRPGGDNDAKYNEIRDQLIRRATFRWVYCDDRRNTVWSWMETLLCTVELVDGQADDAELWYSIKSACTNKAAKSCTLDSVRIDDRRQVADTVCLSQLALIYYPDRPLGKAVRFDQYKGPQSSRIVRR